MSETIMPSNDRATTPARPFRNAILRGLAVLCPPLLTVLIIVWAINTTKSYFLEPVTSWAREGLVWALTDVRHDLPSTLPSTKTTVYENEIYQRLDNGSFIPKYVYDRVLKLSDEPLPTTGDGFYRRYVDLTYLQPFYTIPIFLSVFILLLYFLGKFMAAGIGKFFGGVVDRFLLHLPGVRAVYSAVKQVSDFLFSQRELRVTRVVAVEFPRKGIWSMGFVTGESFMAVEDAAEEPVWAVMIPYSPVPVTGCTIIVRKSECIDLNVTFDQACQFIVSCGVVVPPQQVRQLKAQKDETQ